MSGHVLDLDKVVKLVHLADLPAYVEQTGGGCATIYAGPRAYDRDTEWWRYAAAAGPGWFEGYGWTEGKSHTDEFSIGADDQGEGEYINAGPWWDEGVAAAAIVARVRLSLDEHPDFPWDWSPNFDRNPPVAPKKETA